MQGPCRPRRGAWIWFSSLSEATERLGARGLRFYKVILTAGWGWDCRGQEQSTVSMLEGPGRQQKKQTR